jgi:hypothetical protein
MNISTHHVLFFIQLLIRNIEIALKMTTLNDSKTKIIQNIDFVTNSEKNGKMNIVTIYSLIFDSICNITSEQMA